MSRLLDRRTFLRHSAGTAAAATIALRTLGAHAAWATEGSSTAVEPDGYGPLRRRRSANTREELLALPAGFHYAVISQANEVMSDGNPTPIAFDGMAAFEGPDRSVRLIRNHEVRTTPGSPIGRVLGPAATMYDPLGVGGTTTLDFDPRKRELVRDFVSLNGTIVNCAGGIIMDEFGWLTCEETTAGPTEGWGQKHGYCYVVPLNGPIPGSPATSVPIPEMGRFSHEANATDPSTGVVYLTEDQSGTPNGFYRFVPDDPTDLAAGGDLWMLKVRGIDGYDTREGQTVGDALRVEWVPIEDPDPDLEGGATSVRQQGFDQGAALFNRLEGCWFGGGSILFNSTSGGDVKNGDAPGADGYVEGYGQVWRFVPSATGGRLILVYESTGREEMDSPDNLTITPRGGVMVCEDDASDVDLDTHPLAPDLPNVNRLIGLARDGLPFEFAVNLTDGSEFAGVCFSPDGRYLFVNTFGAADAIDPPGRTYAVWGPWRRGPL
jgi:secreted PhoX family phosphatase